MRLIRIHKDGTLELQEFHKHDIPPYAILSHTWGDSEVTFENFYKETSATQQGYKKILFCREQALKHDLHYFWVDTCCIDKRNHAELSEAINSMFLWYSRASKCFVYLSDVSSLDPISGDMLPSHVWIESFQRSRWFTRGWTLQELIAPGSVQFFSSDGHCLGNKRSLELKITHITGVPTDALRGHPLRDFSVLERFAWAEYRDTAKEEDKAYCLCGIFNVFMPLLYGEGEEKARKRLEKNVRELQDEEMDAQGYHSGDELGSSAFSGGYKAHARLLNVRSMGTLKRRRKSYDNGFGESQSRATIAALFRKAASNHSNLVLLSPWHQALCLPRNIASGSDARSIFRGAHASFLNAVYWDEWPRFETFVDRQEMMADIRGHFQSFKHSSRLMTASEVVDDFSSRLAHFFTAVSFGIEVDPEWSRTLWGAIRLMFVRSLNFPNLFERLAHLLGRIRQELPSYQDYVGRLQADPRGLDKEALGKALAFVYADIVSFCRDACRFFSTPFSNLEHTHDPIMNVLSIPFNLRFESLIARLNEHKLLFAIELRAGKHESLNIFVENVIEDLRKREEYFQSRSTMERLERERDECHSANFTAGVRWILPPEFRAEFDRAKKARSPGSCAWLQSLKAYTMWKESLLTDDVQTTSSRRYTRQHSCTPILLLEGSAGYGKTILSTAMIEDLQSPLSSVEMKDNEVPHATQVVETLAENSAIMDLLSVLKLQTDGSRRIATEQELSEFLLLAVRSLPSVALIFDAIDECHDVEKMWPFLSAACTTTNMKFLLLGRPQIPVHPDVAHLILREELPRTNRLDIYDFLVREIKSMQNRGQLDDRVLAEPTADTLASCADSSFLWASLIMSYLQSPVLSLGERRRELWDPNRLVTMPRLYSGMLQQFEVLYPQDRDLLIKIFRVLVLSKRPPTIRELDVAISVEPGHKLSSKGHRENVMDTLQRLCGALVDIGPNSTVSFSHLSFRSFLLSEEAMDMKSQFRIDRQSSSLWISQVCLSYLVHDVPQTPLGGALDTEADKLVLAEELPFLEYSARHWVEHIVDALRLMSNTLPELVSDCYPLLQQLGSLLGQKSSISAWIEACWTWGFQPSVESLWYELERRLERHDARYQRDARQSQIRKPLDHIHELSEDLKKLQQHWSHLLSVRPYEIWGPSVSAYLGEMSWAYNHEAKVAIVTGDRGSHDMGEMVLKASKLSGCGSLLGVLRVFRPSKEGHFSVYLDSEDLLEVELAAKDQKFTFPVSFASDMSQISILRSLYWVDGLGTVISQKVGLNPALHNNNQDVAAEPRLPRPSATRAMYRRLFTPCGRYLAHLERQNDFNDSSEGLWTFGIWEKEASDILFMGGSAWRQIATLDDVYGDFLIDGDVTLNPQYQMIALMKFVPYSLGKRNITSIWDFRAIPFGSCNDEKTTKTVYGTGLRNLSFSPCGRFLSGDHFYFKEKRVVDIERFTAGALPLMLPISDDLRNFGGPTTRTLQTSTNFARHSFLIESEQIYSAAQDHNHAAPSSNALTLGTRDGKPDYHEGELMRMPTLSGEHLQMLEN
ncbi:hypothetical protein AALT_g4692 [Alternaria alternata]|nr:hypothetical protein AALT_g4692 [Alternaria alternata]